jgi:hypothetical protein
MYAKGAVAADCARAVVAVAIAAGAVFVPQRADVVEQLEYKMQFRWFVGLNMSDAALDPCGVFEES